jgi:signal transduction histidine kinase
VNIVNLARRVIAQHAQDGENDQNGQHSHIVLQSKEEMILGTWDEDRIEQVLTNLITNALKYSPADKPIVVEIEQHSHNPDDEVLVSVHDQGPGIAEEDQVQIFNRFYQVNKTERKPLEGLGLGLYISHEIVTLHGGRIWVNSSQEQGSTFYFTLSLTKSSKHDVKRLPEGDGTKASNQ